MLALLLAILLNGGWIGGVAFSAEADISLTIANTAPVVDLNGADPGIDHQATFPIGGAPVSVVATGSLTVTDLTDGALVQAQARLVNRPNGVQEALDATIAGGITKSYDAATGILTLSGPASVLSYQAVLRTLTYGNLEFTPDVSDRLIQVTVTDGSLVSSVATSTVSLVGNTNRLVIQPTSSAGAPLITSENGAVQLVSLRLSSIPTGTVQVQIGNPAPGEVAVSTTLLTFTPANWSRVQIVLVTGQADGAVDADQVVNLPLTVVAPATNYAGVVASPIMLRNLNVDVPGLALGQSGGTTVMQEGGAGDAVTVALTAKPVGDVTVTVTTGVALTASPTSLIFTTANWNVPRTVNLAAVDDTAVNGTRLVLVGFSVAGSAYDGTTASLTATVMDNDVAGVEVTPVAGLITAEDGRQALVRMRLRSRPVDDVTIPLSRYDPGEGTVAPAALIFTAANWNVYQTATLIGVDDDVIDGDQPWTLVTGLTVSADAAYNGLDPADATVLNRDLDQAALVVTPRSLLVDETGSTAAIQVRLATRPSADITVAVVSSQEAEATVNTASLTFTTADWSTPQTVMVTGQPDGVPDGNQTFVVTLTPAGDATYAALAPVLVTGVNQDTSLPTVLITTPGVLDVYEGLASTTTWLVRLSTDPGDGVSINVTPTMPDGQLARVSAPTLAFTGGGAGTWNVPQAVEVGAVDDAVAEGLHSGQVLHVVTGSYLSATLTLPIHDNDQAGITATPVSDLTTTEVGGTATFTVRLDSQPTGTVTIPVTSEDTAQGTVSPSVLTFTPGGATAWSLAQTVTVTGADGNLTDDGDVPFTVRLGPAGGDDGTYLNRLGPTVGVVNRSVDNPPTIAAIAALVIQEDARPQNVALTGISDGQAGENQTVVVTAGSSDPTLTGPLTVTYASPATTGSLAFTPTANASGTATITITVTDGVSTTVRAVLVTVAAVNDAPWLVRTTPLTVALRGTGTWRGLAVDASIPAQLTAADVETATADLRYRLVLAPAAGHLTRAHVTMVAGDIITQAEVDAGQFDYVHDGGTGTSDGAVLRIEDADGGQSGPVVVQILVVRSPPVVTTAGAATWNEDGGPVAVAVDAVVSDADSPSFDTGRLVVTPVAGGQTGDVLAIRAGGGIGLSGNTVTWNDRSMGIVAGGTWPTALSVTCNAEADTTAVQALLRSIVFDHATRAPTATARTLRIELVDDYGDAAPLRTVTVTMQPVNDPPQVSALSLATNAGAVVSGHLTAIDPDGPGLTFAVYRAPRFGVLDAFDAATGAFTYRPAADAPERDDILVTAHDDIAASAVSVVTITITPVAVTPRLWFVSDPPFEAQAGERLAWTVEVDASILAAPHLQFALDDAPAGMVLTPDADPLRANVTWPTVVGAGHVRFRIRVWDAATQVSEIQPVCLYVHPRPSAIAVLAPGPAEPSIVGWRSGGVLAVLTAFLASVVLRSMPRQKGLSGVRMITEAVRRTMGGL